MKLKCRLVIADTLLRHLAGQHYYLIKVHLEQVIICLLARIWMLTSTKDANQTEESMQPSKNLFILGALVAAALLLAACSGQASSEITAAAEMQEQQAQVAAENSSVESAAMDSNTEDQAAAAENDSAQAQVEADTAAEAGARGIPELVPGSPDLKETQAGVFDRNTGQVQVLEFFAYWCPNCKALASSIHGLENAYQDQVKFTFLDIDKQANEDLKNEYGFYYQPYVLVFDAEGNIVQSWVGGGIHPLEIQAAIETALGNSG
jgi:thiol-disulfide isomerase/thioredoxin